ncbi:MAG: glutathione transferase GstA [Comamonas sp.]
MKLYYSPGACSLSPHIVLEESGLPYQAVLASTKSHQLQDGTDYRTINPLGYVPFLVLDDGESLHEGPAIVQYIADQVPGKRLAPANGTLARYRLQAWLNFIGTELHKSYSPLFKPSTPEDYKAIARDHLAARYAWVEQQLAPDGYLLGEDFSVADAYLFTVTRWARFVGLDLGHHARLQAYLARIAQRPAVQAAIKAEGLKP